MKGAVLAIGLIGALLGPGRIVAATAQTAADQPPPAFPQRYPPPGWPMPVETHPIHTYLVTEKLDVAPGSDGDLTWDVNGWHGGDFNRLWFKSEGEQAFGKAERNIDARLLYGRFVRKYYDAQIGGGIQTATFRDRNVTRGQLVLGLEGFVPYRYDLETLLFISQKGHVSGRVEFIRDYMLTQRLVMQPRVETNIAAQQVEEFGVGRGVNNLELGLRVRYEIRRQFGPYLGLSFDRRFFGAADLARAEGQDPRRARLVFGVRLWR